MNGKTTAAAANAGECGPTTASLLSRLGTRHLRCDYGVVRAVSTATATEPLPQLAGAGCAGVYAELS